MNDFSKPDGQQQDASLTWDPDRVPVEELAEEFMERLRQGDRPSVDEYTAKYPSVADEIRDLFPTVAAMEGLQQRIRQNARLQEPCSLDELGDFHIIGEIGRGGMGIVYEAEQVTLGRRVAVKVLPKHSLRSQRNLQRFHREAQTAARLHHTNIVPVFGVGEQDGVHYIVMQFIQGVGLDEILTELKGIVLDQHDGENETTSSNARTRCANRNATALLTGKLSDATIAQSLSETKNELHVSSESSDPGGNLEETRTGRIDVASPPIVASDDPPKSSPTRNISPEYWRNVARIGVQAARALHYAHSNGTLHRDVKPGNLLLDDQGVVWMADFGLAKAIEHQNVTWSGDVVGTLSYLAPERFKGDGDARSDIYSLGLTLYELLTLERAFDGTDRVALMQRVAQDELVPPRRRNASIPRDLETIVLKAAAKEPSDRYESAENLADDLEAFLEGRPVSARRLRTTEQAVRWCRRNPVMTAMAVALVGAFVTAASAYWQESTQRQRAEDTSQLAIEALDRIYDQFAPDSIKPAPQAPDDNEIDEEELLAVQSQLPISKDVARLLEGLLEFYDQLSLQSEGNADVLLKSMVANRRVGDIHHRLGEADKARSTYERAIKRQQDLNATLTDSKAWKLESARVYNGLGIVLDDLRDSEGAADAHRKALEMLGSWSDAPETQYELARSHYLLHIAEREPWWRRRNDRDTDNVGTNDIARAQTLLENLSHKYPDTAEYRFLLGRCYRATADRRPDAANDNYQRAIDKFDDLVLDYPDAPDYRYELADAHLALVYRTLSPYHDNDTDPPGEVLRQLEQRLVAAIDAAGQIELSHPIIPQYLMLKTRLHHTYANVLVKLERLETAQRQFDRAIEKQRLVVRHVRDGHHHEVYLAYLQLDMAKLLASRRQHEGARIIIVSLQSDLRALLGDSACRLDGRRRRFAERVLTRSEALLSKIKPSSAEPADATESNNSI